MDNVDYRRIDPAGWTLEHLGWAHGTGPIHDHPCLTAECYPVYRRLIAAALIDGPGAGGSMES